ncbi:MAG TPA: hypothetical protein VI566_07850 [Xanthomonadales bacterium]|nr:hypothetical protein [Xanthomonadales bacterium]
MNGKAKRQMEMTGAWGVERSRTPVTPHSPAQPNYLPAIALALSLLVSVPAWAVGSVLSGMFDGSEPAIDSLSGFECAHTPLGYQQSTFEVSTSGTYTFNDAFGSLRSVGGVDVTVLVYEGSFDASAPGKNLIASARVDYPANEAILAAGTAYTLVVQLACVPSKGAWAVAFVGPGTVDSDDAVAVPSFTSGTFDRDGPMMSSNCSDDWGPYPAHFEQSGPIQVSRTGTYYFSTAGIYGLCVSVYSAPVDPAWDREWVNRVGGGYGEGFELKAGQDYYILVQSHGDSYGLAPPALDESDDYFFIMAPPAPFRVSRGLADSWYNPDTPGQGFFLDVFESRNQVFLGWLTYAIDPPADDEFGHRWMTASGPFWGTSADLAIEWTAGGGFDAPDPVPEQHIDGTIELEFTDCTSGQVNYAWGFDIFGNPAVSGVIPIQRIANDSVALCESLYRGPGMPGPL